MPENFSAKSRHSFKIIRGSDRSIYELTLEELHDLLQATHGLQIVKDNCSLEESAQDRCNVVWKRIAEDRGIDWTSIVPAPEKGVEYFSAKKLI